MDSHLDQTLSNYILGPLGNLLLPWFRSLFFLFGSGVSTATSMVDAGLTEGQANITRILSTVFSSVSCCGLLLMSAWFACERWIYHRYEGYMWLSDALGYTMEPIKHFFLSAVRSLHPQNVFEQGRQLIGGGQGSKSLSSPYQ